MKDQLYQLRFWLCICSTFVLLIIICTFALSHITGMPFSYLSRDMAAICNVKAAIGFLSNIGIFLWFSTTAICIFSAIILKDIGHNKQLSFVWFFFISGLLTLWLGLDDVFLFHERLFPYYCHIPERVVHGGYALIVIFYLFFFKEQIMYTDFILLFLSGFLLAASMFTDVFFVYEGNEALFENETIFEDILKFSGITFWLGYFSRAALFLIKKEI